MNVAVILTWVDRRQGAMIQDRVGPNRAVDLAADRRSRRARAGAGAAASAAGVASAWLDADRAAAPRVDGARHRCSASSPSS